VNPYFVGRIAPTADGCWEWTGSRRRGGYGQSTVTMPTGSLMMAHRLSYELHIGPIPEGLTVDHLCFNPPCVNPEHLRLLTLSENAANQRSAYATHCLAGHPYTPENTRVKDRNGRRDCKSCHRLRQSRRYHDPQAAAARPGHPIGQRVHNAVFTPEDVIAIRRRRRSGESVSGLARAYAVSRGAIQGVLSGRNWSHVQEATR
jgi:hypothetical protein